MKYGVITFLAAAVALFSLSCEKAILGPDQASPLPPTQHASRLATLLDSMRYATDLPALAGAIVTDTGIVDAQAVGCRRYGGPANVTNDDQFHLGSCGKSFTAVLLGVLVDEGKVEWTSTLSEIFPEYASTMRAEYREVNLLDLLSHSAGFVRTADVALHTSTPQGQRAEVVAWALMQPPAAPRGRSLYSNLGFTIAGAIADRVADRPYEELLVEKVTRPLGLTTFGFGQMGTEGMEDQPLQHTPNHSPLIATPDARLQLIQNSAGDIHMSIRDWARYCQWMLACEAGRPTILRAETEKMITTLRIVIANNEGNALGWGVINRDWAGGKALTHTGSNGYNYSEVTLAPLRRFGIIVMTNQGSGTISVPTDNIVGRLIMFHLYGH